jgi:hypothetical protein
MKLLISAIIFIMSINILSVKVAIDQKDNVTITWNQISKANYVCVSKQQKTAEYSRYIQIDCFNSIVGPHVFSTHHYGDGAYKHRSGDLYFIEEFLITDTQKELLGKYGPYEALHYFYLPRFDRP